MDRLPVMMVSDPAMWQVLLSPVRFEIVEAMRSVAPCSIAELAATLARPADALYRHVEKLAEAGYVVTRGFRKSGRHTEQLFDLTADDFRLDVSGDPSGNTAVAAVVDTARTVFKSAEKVLEESGAAGALSFAAGERNLVLTYELAWLAPEELAEVVEHMRAIKRITDRRTPPDGSPEVKLYAVLSMASPVTRRGRARHRARPEPGEIESKPETSAVSAAGPLGEQA